MSDFTQTKTKTQAAQGLENIQIQQLFKLMIDKGASDLHMSVGTPPSLRIHGNMVRIRIGKLTPDATQRLIYQILTEAQKKTLEAEREIDFSFGIKGLARFRANVFHANNGWSAVFRQIPTQIPDFHSMGMPSVIMKMTEISNGLILVTGPTGSGKSTTLAAIIDQLNQRESGHIVTLEDPIEFVHPHRNCVVNQREVGTDTYSFTRGLKSLLRQDPDIVLVGELRDLETIEAALKIAETGHLVLATLHTNSCVQTVNRLVNVFPSDQQSRIRTLLSFVLQGVIAQQLLPKADGKGRALVQEILNVNPAIRNLIREDKIHQIYSAMQIGQEKSGMQTMNQSLKRLLDKGVITPEEAMINTVKPEELAKMIGIKM